MESEIHGAGAGVGTVQSDDQLVDFDDVRFRTVRTWQVAEVSDGPTDTLNDVIDDFEGRCWLARVEDPRGTTNRRVAVAQLRSFV